MNASGNRAGFFSMAASIFMMLIYFAPSAFAGQTHIILTEDYLQGGGSAHVRAELASAAPIEVLIPGPADGSVDQDSAPRIRAGFVFRRVKVAGSSLSRDDFQAAENLWRWLGSASRAPEASKLPPGSTPLVAAFRSFQMFMADTSLPPGVFAAPADNAGGVGANPTEAFFLASLRAAALEFAGRKAEAAQLLRAVAASPLTDARYWLRIARLEAEDENIPAAEEALSHCESASETREEALLIRAWLFWKGSADSRALDLLDRLQESDFSNADAHALRGLILEKAGNDQAALSEYLAARFFSKNAPEAASASITARIDRMRARSRAERVKGGAR